jgi:hypothetical protein
VISHRSRFADTNYIDGEGAHAILFTALCEGMVLDDGDLAQRVKDRLASMPESSAWPILNKAASDDSPCRWELDWRSVRHGRQRWIRAVDLRPASR